MIILEYISTMMFFILNSYLEYYFYVINRLQYLTKTAQYMAMPLWGLPIHNHETYDMKEDKEVETINDCTRDYVESQIGESELNFYDDVLTSVTTLEEELHLTEDCSLNLTNLIPPPEPAVEYLTMDSWEESTQVKVEKQFADISDTKIIDMKNGKQLWVVEVIGEEQGYLHVSDGTARSWVNATAYDCIRRGDILKLVINRENEDSVNVYHVEILQSRSSDFSILDDEDYLQYEEIKIA